MQNIISDTHPQRYPLFGVGRVSILKAIGEAIASPFLFLGVAPSPVSVSAHCLDPAKACLSFSHPGPRPRLRLPDALRFFKIRGSNLHKGELS